MAENAAGQEQDGPLGVGSQGRHGWRCNFLREALLVLVQGIRDTEVSAQIGARRGERNPGRITQPNGDRFREWDSQIGTNGQRYPRSGKRVLPPTGWEAAHVAIWTC